MAKLLKPLIVVLLVLSIVSLVLGIMLFGRREVLKGRAAKFEDAVVKFAEKIHFEQLDRQMLQDYAAMQVPLEHLAAFADNQYEKLQNTIQDLDKTRGELQQATNRIVELTAHLEETQQKVTELQDQLEAKDVELAQANSRVDQLTQDKSLLEEQVSKLNDKLVAAEEQTRDLQDQVTTLENTVQDMEVRLGERLAAPLPKGLSGHVLVVDPYWNFVVLDIGSKDGLAPSAEMLVHRGDKLVGKVRISSVKEKMAIAEIVSDWEQVPIREGDYVLY